MKKQFNTIQKVIITLLIFQEFKYIKKFIFMNIE